MCADLIVHGKKNIIRFLWYKSSIFVIYCAMSGLQGYVSSSLRRCKPVSRLLRGIIHGIQAQDALHLYLRGGTSPIRRHFIVIINLQNNTHTHITHMSHTANHTLLNDATNIIDCYILHIICIE